MTFYLQWPINKLPLAVGIDHDAGMRSAHNIAGFLSYGPYCKLDPGAYFGGFRIKSLIKSNNSNIIQISACNNLGKNTLNTRQISGYEIFTSIAGLIGVVFQITDTCTDVEIRLHVTELASIEVYDLVIFRYNVK